MPKSAHETVTKHITNKNNLSELSVANNFGFNFVKQVDDLKINCHSKILPAHTNGTVSQAIQAFSSFNLPTNEDIIKILKVMKENKSPGSDKIRMKDLKLNINNESLINALKNLVSDSIALSIVPNKLKEASVIPIHKKRLFFRLC